MSNINIKRAVENIKSTTTVYTPVVEMIINAVQAIDETGRPGTVYVKVMRSREVGMFDEEGTLPEVTGFHIVDDGIGFNDAHRNSFDTLFTDLKINEGGKGFGRFTCLKYFEDLDVDSVFHTKGETYRRKFSMGKGHDIIVDETIEPSIGHATGTIVHLKNLKKVGSFDKKLETIARHLVERMLPYFITDGYDCPRIVLCEADGSGPIILNDYLSNELAAVIKEIAVNPATFHLNTPDGNTSFTVRVFKIFFPKNQSSKLSLVAHRREVSGSQLQKYVPEFSEEFYDKENTGRNYIIKAYVFGEYLDRHVSLERGGFEFQMQSDLFFPIGQAEIERNAAMIAQSAVGEDITSRQQKKTERVQSYVDSKAPWHKNILPTADLSTLPLNPSEEQIEARLQEEKYKKEAQIRREVSSLLSNATLENLDEDVSKLVTKISDTSRNDLIHYIALRRNILDLFGRSLEKTADGKYESEGVVHDIIFPREGDSERTDFVEHNLWIIDERLNFTSYVSSDVPMNGKFSDRPDLLIYDNRIVFRGDNEPSNPVTIFEFKRPYRDDFANPSSKEDPVQQIIRYVNNIRDGKYTTPEGRPIQVAENTPFYGFVVCETTQKVKDWLKREKDFTEMPDGLGWFNWFKSIKLYVEVLSWDKVVKDAKLRNKVFFHKLGIDD